MRCAPSRLAAAAVFLAACGPASTPAPTLPAIARVAVSPALEPLAAGWARGYRDRFGVPDFDLDVVSADAALEGAAEEQFEAVITSAEPAEGWFATPLGREAVAVIVHADNPVRDLSLDELAALFSGAVRSWVEVGGDEIPVLPVYLFEGDELRPIFEAGVMKGVRPSPFALLAPTPGAVVEAVGEDPGAVGLVPLSAAAGAARLVRVEGVLPGAATIADGRYPLAFEVLATAPDEPEGAVRDWLVWIQSGGPAAAP